VRGCVASDEKTSIKSGTKYRQSIARSGLVPNHRMTVGAPQAEVWAAPTGIVNFGALASRRSCGKLYQTETERERQSHGNVES
jgi:hypothetical protein